MARVSKPLSVNVFRATRQLDVRLMLLGHIWSPDPQLVVNKPRALSAVLKAKRAASLFICLFLSGNATFGVQK